jgi:tetratricopeptide (TPR) repeat protein
MKRADSESGEASARGAQVRKVHSELQSLAAEALQERRWELARRLLISSIDLGADDPEVFFTVAYCCGSVGDHDDAAGWYEEAIGEPEAMRPVAPDHLLPRLYNNYAATLVKLRREDEALEWYRKSVQADENYPAVYYNLGRLYEDHLGQPEDAVRAYRRHMALGGSRSADAARHIQKLENRE